jgi:predicted Zn finger-like uncharacterized protein
MLTRCPACRTVFRVTPEALRARRGRVRCGRCRAAFDALAALTEEGPPGRIAPPSITPDAEPGHAPGPSTEAASRPRRRSIADAADDGAVATAAELDLLASPLRPERPLLWGSVALVLLLALAAQALWHGQAQLMRRFPATEAAYRSICAQLGCEVERLRRLDALAVTARDVREHPRYAAALLVNVTVVNRAPFAQEFPRLQLILYGVAGTPRAARRFQPEEYLDESIDVESGMAPGVPVHVVLELSDADIDAVGFEFEFL